MGVIWPSTRCWRCFNGAVSRTGRSWSLRSRPHPSHVLHHAWAAKTVAATPRGAQSCAWRSFPSPSARPPRLPSRGGGGSRQQAKRQSARCLITTRAAARYGLKTSGSRLRRGRSACATPPPLPMPYPLKPRPYAKPPIPPVESPLARMDRAGAAAPRPHPRRRSSVGRRARRHRHHAAGQNASMPDPHRAPGAGVG